MSDMLMRKTILGDAYEPAATIYLLLLYQGSEMVAMARASLYLMGLPRLARAHVDLGPFDPAPPLYI